MPRKELDEQELSALAAKRKAQAEFRAYLDQQVAQRKSAEAATKQLTMHFAQHQQDAYAAWKAGEDARAVDKQARKAVVRYELEAQIAKDTVRRTQIKQEFRAGPSREPPAFDLVESPRLETLGVAVRYTPVLREGRSPPKIEKLSKFI